jgi:hypothetical protein
MDVSSRHPDDCIIGTSVRVTDELVTEAEYEARLPHPAMRSNCDEMSPCHIRNDRPQSVLRLGALNIIDWSGRQVIENDAVVTS